MEHVRNFNFPTLRPYNSIREVLYANTVFSKIDDIFSIKDAPILCTSILTPTQKINVPFNKLNGLTHPYLTNFVLSMIYPDYKLEYPQRSDIYSKNLRNNIFILIFGDTTTKGITVQLGENQKITLAQFESLKEFFDDVRTSDAAKSGKITAIFLGNEMISIDDIETYLESLKRNIVADFDFPREIPISKLDFSSCKSYEERMKLANEFGYIHMDKLFKAQDERDTIPTSTAENNFATNLDDTGIGLE